MAARTSWRGGRGVAFPRASPGAWVLALAFPVLLVHIDFQPGFDATVGSTHAHIVLSDLAVLACVAAAVVAAVLHGPGRLRRGRAVWLATGLYLAFVCAATVYPLRGSDPYPWHDHVVTTGKYVEYALLAPAVVLLLRSADDLLLLLLAVVASSVAASALSVVQFFGWRIAGGWPAGYRQPSFLGHHDFASLSGFALAIALAAIALPAWRVDRRIAGAAGVSGAVGLLVSGSLAGAIGLLAGGVVCAFVAREARRRAGAILAISLAVFGGVVLFRGGDVKSFLHFAGIGKEQEQLGVESYVQRTMLVYYGWRVFLDHPALGAGWQASNDAYVFTPLLPALHRTFPNTPEPAFPSAAHPYGVQNAYVQALADLGVVGLLLFLGALVTPLLVGGARLVRGPPPGPAALLPVPWLLVTMGVLTAIGLVAGIPLDAMLWIAAGLCAASSPA
ncbi:MAG TPA: O-antigen ligase family protein [Gaiellaceae bacterium]|nr:O-antigen ligase family protein [Gaiellaceae bacterium]